MQNTFLCPKDFIKNSESFSQFQCNICFQICVRPAQCKGTCQKIFCMKCVSEWRIERDTCPLRCSSPFQVNVLDELKIQFECPYDMKKCFEPIKSLQEFNDHYKHCKFVPQEQIYRQKLKRQFKCLKGHQLQFFIGSYDQMCNSECTLCHFKKLCRAICRKCDNKLFCVECRTPPCQKGKCPIGHQMKLLNYSNLAYICDICGISTAISNNNVYDDSECNFGICQQCFVKIQEKNNSAEPTFKLQANKHNECQQGHKLTISQAENILSICGFCSKQKQCPKQCLDCHKRYCLACKPISIQGDETCEQGHAFIKISPQTIGPAAQGSYKCMKCSKISSSCLYDKFCRIELCQQCFLYGVMIASQKERFIEQITCQKGHVLRYMNNPESHQGSCFLCKRWMPGKLFCDFCQIKNQCYCCACKPMSKFDTCYFGHPLTQIKQLGLGQKPVCALCNVKQDKIIGCKKCSFYICQKCQIQFDPNSFFLEEQSWMIDQSEELSSIQKVSKQ